MRDHNDLLNMNERSLEQQAAVRRATFSPGEIKALRPFSIWEISQFMFDVPADTLRKKLADDPSLPQGLTEEDGRQRWFTLEEINELRRRYDDPDDCPYPSADELPEDVQSIGAQRFQDFIQRTCWPTIDIIPSCANAAFVEFASAQYRSLHKAWSFFGCVDRYLDELPDDQYDIIIFDCPPAIGYQSLNAAFAADILYIPSGPGYWEYDSTTSYLGQLGDAMADISEGFSALAADAGITLPKRFSDIRLLMTRFEASNPLHSAMMDAFKNVFGADVCANPIEMTRAVEQSGRFQMSVYEQDYRQMTRETWKRARQSFDRAYGEFLQTVLAAWKENDKRKEAAE